MGKKLQITLAAELASLLAFRSFIGEACQEAKLDDETCYDIKLAVDEACTNIIEHGYADMEPGSIVLSLQYGVRQIVVRLTDFGRPFEPSEPPVDRDVAREEESIAPVATTGWLGFSMFKYGPRMNSQAIRQRSGIEP